MRRLPIARGEFKATRCRRRETDWYSAVRREKSGAREKVSMKSFPLVLIAFIWGLLHVARGAAQAPADPAALDAVLKKMDATAASFRATQADFEWDRYEKVINEVDDVQSGTIYYRRAGKDIEMMADIKQEGGSVAE